MGVEHMKKRQIAFVLGVLVVLNGLVTISPINAEEACLNITDTVEFVNPLITEKNDELLVTLPQATSYRSSGGYLLPTVTKVITLPFQSSVESVEVEFSTYETISVSHQPVAVEQSVSDTSRLNQISLKGQKSLMDYPTEESFSYHVSAGKLGSEIVNYLVIQLKPIYYDEMSKTLSVSDSAHIEVTYTASEQVNTFPDEYDLLIISPKEFADPLQPLVEHKQNHDVATILVTMDDITSGTYHEVTGRDDAEQVKYFIKFALETWGIEYVLLVGGRNGGINEPSWWVPVRYSNLDDGNEPTFISDLYFADIYDSDGNFSSWDANNNDLFSEWSLMKKDIPDLYPDVSVGRLACRSKAEVATMVQKIITYEATTYGADWFYRFIGISGDTYPDETDPFFEGELATEVSGQLLADLGFSSTFLWTSLGTFNGPDEVISAISEGAGFVHFSGHGNPYIWSNHPPQNKSGWVSGPTAFDMDELTNKDKFPVVIVGGCHNGQFDVGLLNIVRDLIKYGIKEYFFSPPYMFYHMEWIPHCWSWSLINKDGGGGIAVISNTGLGYGIPGEQWDTGNGRWMEMNFFKSYAEGYSILGQAHSMNIINYLNEFYANEDAVDYKIPQEWALLGDPSLKIGGFQ